MFSSSTSTHSNSLLLQLGGGAGGPTPFMPVKQSSASFYGLWESMTVGALGPLRGTTSSLWAIGTTLVPFPWILPQQAGEGGIWAHMVPIQNANKQETEALTRCDPV